MKKLIINHIGFRVLAPLITGVLVYFLVLMFFDSLLQLKTNFFGNELLLTIVISYVNFFFLRLAVQIWEKYLPIEKSIQKRIIVQFTAGVLVAFIATVLLIGIYFQYILGFSEFNREATIFVSLFVLISLTYNLLFFSIFYLNKENKLAIEQEESMKSLLINDFRGLLRDTRPELFSIGMEALVVQLRKDKNLADKFIYKFCEIYRYNLNAKKKEIVFLEEEITNLKNLLFILNGKYENNIQLDLKIKAEQLSYLLLPNTLQIAIEETVYSSIVGKESPVVINISINADLNLVISHNGLPKISESFDYQELKLLSNSQKYYTSKEIIIEQNLNATLCSIPLIVNEIDSLE